MALRCSLLNAVKRLRANWLEIGKRLYKTVFGSLEAMGILQAWRLQQGDAASDQYYQRYSQCAQSCPGNCFTMSRDFSPCVPDIRSQLCVAYRNVNWLHYPTPFEPPLRMLLVTARPEDTGFIDPRGVARELLDEVDEQIELGDRRTGVFAPTDPYRVAQSTQGYNKAHPYPAFRWSWRLCKGSASQDGLS